MPTQAQIRREFRARFGDNPALWEQFVAFCQSQAEGVYKSPPVSAREFFTSSYYIGDMAGTLYPEVVNALCESQSGDYVEAVLTGGIGVSKALDVATPIPTPTGWTLMGDLKAGDKVYGLDGRPCTVTMAHPVREDRPCYEVEFSDGAVIVADGEHNWWTQTRSERRRGKPGAVRTTDELRCTLKHRTVRAVMNNHSVPVSAPVSGSARTLVVDPYLLGLWLGDGSKEGNKFWTEDYALADAFRQHYTVRQYDRISFSITGGLREDLHTYGLIENKHIPAHYQRAPVADRMSLLQGLMDTDGTIQGNARLASITQVDTRLAEDVFELIAGLGFKPTKTLVKTTCQTGAIGEAWVIRFSAHSDRPVFRLPRKLTLQPAPPAVQKERHRLRYIVDIRPVESRPVRCITVDSPDALYLAGEHFIPTHNTTIALLGTLYGLYLLSLMWNPQKTFGLIPGDEIVIMFQSITGDLAKDVNYARFYERVQASPYFMEQFPPDPTIRSELRFHNSIYVRALTGVESAAIGQNIFMGMIDEVNFMAVIQDSKQSVDGGTYDQAQSLYRAVKRRRESRFMQAGGKLPGVLYLVSSKRYPGEFTDQKMDEARAEAAEKGRSRIYIYDKKIWEVQPNKFSGEFFRVFVGDETRAPYVLEEDEALRPEDQHLELKVPVEYKQGFENDILDALRDVGGTSTLAINPFIMNTEKVAAMFGQVPSCLSSTFCDFQDNKITVFPKAFRNPNEPRFVHLDLAVRGDSAGVVCGHVSGFRKVDRGDGMVEVLPEIDLDFILEVRPPKGGEIIFEKIRKLIYTVSGQGIPVRWVTLDSFQSRDTIQIMRAKGYLSGLQSVDITPQPYAVTKTAILDGRLRAPMHERARRELVRLEQNSQTGKIDHPANGSKDLSDGIAGVVFGLSTRREIWARWNVLSQLPPSLLPKQDQLKEKA